MLYRSVILVSTALARTHGDDSTRPRLASSTNREESEEERGTPERLQPGREHRRASYTYCGFSSFYLQLLRDQKAGLTWVAINHHLGGLPLPRDTDQTAAE